ncbi:MAG TPA: helix-turn-helix domain-containing protein [Pilimelia sp.]|nr:helix-turn-helix domain-containing protein [Pilimelia sp.]
MDRRAAAANPSVRALSRDLLTKVDDLTSQLCERIQAADDLYRGGQVVPTDDLWQSCRQNLELILTQLAGDAPAGVEPARATGRRRAEQGIPLPAILHAYRIGGRYIWDTLVVHADTSDTARDALLVAAADIWTIIDDYSEALIEAYRETIAERARRNAQVRAAMLGSVLDGNAGDGQGLWEAAATLQLPHQGTFVVVAAETRAAGDEALPRAEEALRRYGVASAWRLETARQVGVVAIRPPLTVSKLCQRLASLAGGRVGVSEAFAGLDQTASALRQAQMACAAATPGSRDIVRYEQEPIAVLLASVPELGGNVASAVLGPLLALPAPDRDMLLGTLRAWFAADGSATAAAARLHVHRNTVHHRLRRVEQLTGRRLTRPTAVGELHLALESARMFGVAGRPAGAG